MKIVVMSDTHLNQVTSEFRVLCSRYCDTADLVVHCGDFARASVLDYLETYPLEAVAGNTDDAVIQSRLPAKKVIRVGGFRLGIIHGWGTGSDLKAKLSREFSEVDAILFGHTHQAMQVEENSVFWFNPGSVFLGRGSSPCSLGILHVEERITGEIITL